MDASQEAWLLLRGFTALVAVVALAFLVLRFGLPLLVQQRGQGRMRRLRVEESLLLDRNHRLYVVRWEARLLLLATSPERVQVLARGRESPSEEGPEREAASQPPAQGEGGPA